MNDTDSANPFESPKQLTVSSPPSLDDPIPYECTPTIDDLNAALRSIPSIVFGGIFLLTLGLVFFVGLMRFAAKQFDGILYLGCLAVGLLFIWLLARSLIAGIHAAKVHLAFNPHALTHLSGELTKDGLLLKSEHRVNWQSHAALTFFQHKKRQLLLSHDPQGMVFKVLPVRGFQAPGIASRFLELKSE